MYRTARNYDKISTQQPWSFYLERAYKTILAFGCFDNATSTFQCIPNVGVMDGTVFREVCHDTYQPAHKNAIMCNITPRPTVTHTLRR